MNKWQVGVLVLAAFASLMVLAVQDRDHMVRTCRIAPNEALCRFTWEAGGERGAKAEIAREYRAAGYGN
jgi:hypothetical protein